MRDLPDALKSGEAARLIPVVADTSREKRVTSVLLAAMLGIPDFAASLLSTLGERVGKRAKLSAFTEVVLVEQPKNLKDRPDGLLVVDTGKRRWTALVEAKIGSAELNAEQLERYVELAKANGIDAVITLSNQFVARPDHHPIRLPKVMTRKVSVFHWSWMYVLTQAHLLDMGKDVSDADQAWLLHEFIRFLSHPSAGVDGFDRMNKEWKDVVKTVQSGGVLKRTSEEVERTLASWHQESRDLCLILSRHLGLSVKQRLPRQHQASPTDRLKDDCRDLVEAKALTCALVIPHAAGDMHILADLQTRTITCSMRLQAPQDRQQTKARVNWLVRQLAKANDPDIFIRAVWPSRAPDTMGSLAILRDDPTAIQTDNPKQAPRAFDVLLVKDLAGKFGGSMTFIQQLEAQVVLFYDQVGQYLRAWQPAPPKPQSARPQESAAPASETEGITLSEEVA